MKTRRFTSIEGFGDGTDYIKVKDGKTWIVLKNGEYRETSSFAIDACLDLVKGGVWKEITTPDDVALIARLNAHEFKVGDRVRIIGTRTEAPSWDRGACHNSLKFNGKTAEVLSLHKTNAYFSSSYVYCQTADSLRYSFYADELELIESHSTSPQSQQNQTKEQDMKPYAVIYHSYSQMSSINGQYSTEAEAKEAAEILVTGQRATTSKQYFTVTILNTKTGELIGSVTDAPPAVDWAKK